MLHAFAYSEDIGIRRLHKVVHHNAAIDLQPRFAPKLHIRTNPRRDDHEICFHAAAILECHACRFSIPENCRGIALQQDFHAKTFHFRLEVTAAREIELALHQRVHQVNNRYVAALHLQTARRFESKQASADHNGFLSRRCAIKQHARVVQIAKNEHTFLFRSLHRRDQRRASRGNQELVERRYAAIIAGHCFALGIYIGNSNAETQVNSMTLIPLQTVQLNFIRCLLSGEHGGKQDAVVVDVSFISENRDFKFWRMLQNLFDTSHARHAVPDNHKLFHSHKLS